MDMGVLSHPETLVPPVKLAAAKIFIGSIKLAQSAKVVTLERMRFQGIDEK